MSKHFAYYNEFDPHAAQWLRNLISRNLIMDGEVDTRSITDVQPGDLNGFTRKHFFAGIGGWDYAIRLANWPEDREVWTGSCPCQPFSVAGKKKGTADKRHLWPDFHRLIRACRPSVVFGEQVSSKDALGWFDGVCSDLEDEGYAAEAVDFPACSVGAPHIRNRLWWVGRDEWGDYGISHTGCIDSSGRRGAGELVGATGTAEAETQQWEWLRNAADDCGAVNGISDSMGQRRSGRHPGLHSDTGETESPDSPLVGWLRDPDFPRSQGRSVGPDEHADQRSAGETGEPVGGIRYSDSSGRETQWHISGGTSEKSGQFEDTSAPAGRIPNPSQTPRLGTVGRGNSWSDSGRSGETYSHDPWSSFHLVHCLDGKTRRVGTGVQPLVNGSAFRMGSGSAYEGRSRSGMLKGYGNGIVAQLAAQWVMSFMDVYFNQEKKETNAAR